MAEKILQVKDLIVNFRTDSGIVRAVRDVSFDLHKGETLCIVGESGSGKSVTSKAIMQILANNALVDGGEIIYDGKDLLKIPEEDMVKLRGDKIAMIFQDPLSSLNPIVKVGKQLTEAMLLKSGSNSKNARRNFNGKLGLLVECRNAIATADSQRAYNEEQCHTFDNFCITSTKLEGAYNEKHRIVEELKAEIEEKLFLIDKNQNVKIPAFLRLIEKQFPQTIHPDLVEENAETAALLARVSAGVGSARKTKKLDASARAAVDEIHALLEAALQKEKPNYFTLGYYMLKNPNDTAKIDAMELHELNAMTREYLDKNFMLAFISESAKAIQYSHDRSIAAKKKALSETDVLLRYLETEKLEKKATLDYLKGKIALVEDAIDRMEIEKDGAQYTFGSGITHAVRVYFHALKQNPKEQARFEKEMAKWNALDAKGKTPDWKVVPAAIIDEEQAKENIRLVIRNLQASLRRDIEADGQFDAEAKTVALIDWLKEQASAVVYHVSKKMAKARAIKLLKEVGLPDPELRYNQYPFEFSGGMRQRIVIAIALAADPDILICDEPTTALDVTIQSQILELINRIKKERNLSVIFITHDLGVVANMADRIAVMYAGKIVECGTANDIFYDPRHPYTWALLSSMPDLDTKEKLEAIPGTPPNMIYPPKGDAFAPRNKYAMEIDFEQQPPMFSVSDTHYAATWLLHPDAPKTEPPRIVTERIARMKKKAQNAAAKEVENHG